MNLRALPARYCRAFNARDFDALREVFDEDVELVVDGMSFHGADAAIAYGLESVSRSPGLYIASERVIAQSGDTIVTEVRLVNGDRASAHSRPQGRSCTIWRGRGGRIVSCHGYYMAEPADRTDAVVVPSRAEAAVVAEEQAALRRVATLVVRGVSQETLFAAVTQEIGWLVGADPTALMRFEPDDTVTMVAAWSVRDVDFPIGSSRPMGEELRSMRETGRPSRRAPADLPSSGPFVEEARALGIRTAVGVPIVVDGRVWGVAFASSAAEKPFADNAEARLENFTELVAAAISNAQAQADMRRLAEEQAALRRVATLVAEGAAPGAVFDAVAAEMEGLLGADQVSLCRYEPGDVILVVAHRGPDVARTPVRSRLSHEGESVTATVRRTGRPARMENFEGAPGALAELARSTGLTATVGAPIVVDGRLWGVIAASWKRERSPSADTEERMTRFAQLLDTAIANADSRDQLTASRARLLTEADQARRRVVRDLHDGTQQRLVQTILALKLAQRALQQKDGKAESLVAEALKRAEQGNVELRELAHGILPAALTCGGLRAGVDTVAARIDLSVQTDVTAERFPADIEASAYFIVAEALTNVVKHSHATHAEVRATVENEILHIDICDDGIGDADPDGHGLLGIGDRATALGGQLKIESPPNGGTLIAATLPLSAVYQARDG
jgi:signal transduction histidine kinase